MEIVLFINSADKERVDKSAYLSQLGELEGYLRDPASLENPTITLQLKNAVASGIADADNVQVVDADGNAIASSFRITDANYMYIPEFGRYYYITDITMHHSGLFIISARVDALMSFKEYIKELNCFVSRNEFEYDPSLQDELLPLAYTKRITEVVPPDGALVNVYMGAPGLRNVIATFVTDQAKIQNLNLGSITAPTSSGLPSFDPERYVSYSTFLPFVMDADMLNGLGRAVIRDDTIASYVRSIVALPFFLPSWSYGSDRVIHKGHFDTGNPQASEIWVEGINGNPGYWLKGNPTSVFSPYLIVADFKVPGYTDFLDFSPYTHFELYLPFLGFVELNYQAIAGHRVIVYYAVNYEDGAGNVYVYDLTSHRMVYSNSCQVGIPIALNTTNSKENATARTSQNLNLALNMLSAIASIGVGAFTENPVAIAGGILKAGGAITGYVNANMNIFDRASVSFANSINAMYSHLEVRYRITHTRKTISDTDMDKFAHSTGRPLREYRTLRELSGFTIAQSVHLDGIPCLAGEADIISSMLSSGVIL